VQPLNFLHKEVSISQIPYYLPFFGGGGGGFLCPGKLFVSGLGLGGSVGLGWGIGVCCSLLMIFIF